MQSARACIENATGGRVEGVIGTVIPTYLSYNNG
jgi:hypothetical protein